MVRDLHALLRAQGLSPARLTAWWWGDAALGRWCSCCGTDPAPEKMDCRHSVPAGRVCLGEAVHKQDLCLVFLVSPRLGGST